MIERNGVLCYNNQKSMKHTKNTISVLLIGVLTLSPLTAVAKQGAELIVDDSIAGIGTLVDIHGVTGTDDVTLVVETPAGQTKSVHLALTNGAGSTTIPGSLTREAGTYTVSAQADGATVATTTAAVLPESMDPVSSTIETDTRHIDSDGRDEATVDVTLTDRYGNVLPGRPVTLIASRTDDSVVPLSQETDNRGVQSFSVSTRDEGTVTLRALDLLSGNLLAASIEIDAGYGAVGNDDSYTTSKAGGRLYYAQVSGGFDVIDRFQITAPSTMTAGVEAPKITISAVDRDGNIVEDYVGTVLFSSSDPDATLPNFGKYTFKDRDLGAKEFPLVLKFRANGEQIFRVEDQNDNRITGEASIMVSGSSVTGGGTKTITVTSHKDGDSVNTTSIVLTGKGPAFANLIVMGGTEDQSVATDADGTFSIPLTLNASQKDFTIRVRDDAGRNDSGPIHLILDQEAPVIKTVTFSPDEPQAGDKILVTAESDPGLKSLVMTIDKTAASLSSDVVLKETGSTGSYQAVFTVADAGAYQPSLVAIDAAGNKTELRATLAVGIQTLPVVQNLSAEPRLSAAALSWDALDGPLDGYRVYVGDKPDNFLYTLDTQSLTTSATVAGLTPGQTYYFAVTGIKGDSESKEKSKVAKVDILGLTLEVAPADGALGIKWSSIKADVPLASYLLEFGLEGSPYTESRYINGELREFTLRDLLNGIPYSLRLTPVSITGQKLEELAATGQGTPSALSAGFNPSAADPIPFISATHPGGVAQPAPHTPSSGIPPFAWILMAGAGMAGVYLRLRHKQKIQKTAAFLSAIQSQYHS